MPRTYPFDALRAAALWFWRKAEWARRGGDHGLAAGYIACWHECWRAIDELPGDCRGK